MFFGWMEPAVPKFVECNQTIRIKVLIFNCKDSVSEGKTISQASRQIGVTEQTYYRWRKEYGGLNTGQAKRLKNLEKENSRLKRLVADLSLDNAALKDFASGNL